MKVKSLITITNPDLFDNCTLMFRTLRVGFPTAEIEVTDNATIDPTHRRRIRELCAASNVDYSYSSHRLHHAEWICNSIELGQGKLIIVDPDTMFWKSCEGPEFDFPTHIAGYHVPVIYNEFARCVSFERLHTSFLVVKDCEALVDATQQLYQPACAEGGEYCPFDPYMPCVKAVRGKYMFWDSCANLYNMVGGTHFTETQLECYDHLNSAGFYDIMLSRVDDPTSFEHQHKVAKTNPESLRGFYKAVDNYYKRMNEKAIAMEKAL